MRQIVTRSSAKKQNPASQAQNDNLGSGKKARLPLLPIKKVISKNSAQQSVKSQPSSKMHSAVSSAQKKVIPMFPSQIVTRKFAKLKNLTHLLQPSSKPVNPVKSNIVTRHMASLQLPSPPPAHHTKQRFSKKIPEQEEQKQNLVEKPVAVSGLCSQRSTSFDSQSLRNLEDLPDFSVELRDLLSDSQQLQSPATQHAMNKKSAQQPLLDRESETADDFSRFKQKSDNFEEPKPLQAPPVSSFFNGTAEDEAQARPAAPITTEIVTQEPQVIAERPCGPYANFDAYAEIMSRKVRQEEHVYSNFIMNHNVHQSRMSSHDYKHLLNSVTLRMSMYDPSFDFEEEPELLLCHQNSSYDPCYNYQYFPNPTVRLNWPQHVNSSLHYQQQYQSQQI